MSYKILHFSDLHLDISFAGQGFPRDYGIERRLDLRATLTRIMAHARELEVDAITIGGNLFVQEYLLPETASFLHQQFALLAPIKVVIASGSRDPYTNDSPYALLNWPENVHVFCRSKLTHLELTSDIALWGACNPSAWGQGLFSGFRPTKKVNILLLSAPYQLDWSEKQTPTVEDVQKAGFSLALLGGEQIAATYPAEDPLLIYPGSPEPLAPSDENGLHQVIFVEVDEENISIQPISLQQWHYITLEVDITECSSTADAARLIGTSLEGMITKVPRSAISIILRGQPRFDINLSNLRQSIETSAFFRLDYHFELTYDLEQLAREQTVRGLLVRRFQERINSTADKSERQKQLTSLNLALRALEGEQAGLYETKEN